MNLKSIRSQLQQNEFDALIVTRNNMFIGEDITDQENKIAELSGFGGSAATLLITSENCFLFVDGRYQIQARQETDPSQITVIDLVGSALSQIKDMCVKQNIKKLAYDPWCLSVRDVHFLEAQNTFKCLPCFDFNFGAVLENDVVCFTHEYCGKTSAEKCSEVAQKLPLFADAFLITAADQVSWLSNLRSKALPETPVLRAYAVLDKKGGLTVFSDHCLSDKVKPLSSVFSFLEKYKGKTVLADFNTTPQAVLCALPQGVTLKPIEQNPLLEIKLAKSAVELEGFIKAHIRDGVAVSKFLCWLETNRHGLTELDVVHKLHEYRAEQPLFFSESFATIAASGKHAAIVHYQPSVKSNVPLEENSVLLLDSGGQYYDGTTDVTRTIALGEPEAEIKNSYTQVLKAHIALATAKFPIGTTGYQLDSIARSVLWRFGKDYKHGTGHSVGHFSNVHEAPFGLSPKNKNPIFENYITSNEPGYYQEGHYGIRIENMVYAVCSDENGFLEFQNLTLIPIDKRLINTYLLNNGERAWLNNYHLKVWNCLEPYMDDYEKEWLKGACSPI